MDRKKLIQIGLMVATVGVTATTIYFGFRYLRKKALEKKKQKDSASADPGNSATAKTSGTVNSPQTAVQGRGPTIGSPRPGATQGKG